MFILLQCALFTFCRFVVHDVDEKNLNDTYIEIMVMDKGRLRAAQPLGQVFTISVK